eukprot:SAG31_NODE_1590_length_7805_cov_3.417390_2_plen_48_part_00
MTYIEGATKSVADRDPPPGIYIGSASQLLYALVAGLSKLGRWLVKTW